MSLGCRGTTRPALFREEPDRPGHRRPTSGNQPGHLRRSGRNADTGGQYVRESRVSRGNRVEHSAGHVLVVVVGDGDDARAR